MSSQIKTQTVVNAPSFEDALHMFFEWCLSWTKSEPIQLYQWSPSDLQQLTEEIEWKGCSLSEQEKGLLNIWFDFQEEFDKKIGFKRQLSLKDALMYTGIDLVGRLHDDLDDARNTAHLLRVVRIPSLYEEQLKSVSGALHGEKMTSTLGELFDFSVLSIPA